jgi:hypothetical protein
MTSFFEKARLAAEETSRELTERAKAEAPGAKERARVVAGQAQSGAKDVAGQARRQFVTAIEKIDPAILADVVIKATALQEMANASLRTKSSAYRIAEIVVTATIPPQISFGIHRIHDLEAEDGEDGVDSATLMATGAVDDAPAVVIDLDASGSAATDQA